MDFAEMKVAAQDAMDPLAWGYYAGIAGTESDADRDAAAWQQIDLVPRVLRGVSAIDTSIALPPAAHAGGTVLATPVMVAATAAHGLACAGGESAAGRVAGNRDALMTYSHSASVPVSDFGASTTGPWWAQVYLQQDRGLTREYLHRAQAAGAGALVLTVDVAGAISEAEFRRTIQSQLTVRPGNFPDLTWQQMSASFAAGLTLDDISEVAALTGLPVHVKGVLQGQDAVRAIDAGGSGIIVSNHGRRQVAGVVATADALSAVVDAVGGRVPVMVDGGIRSGVDVLRALAIGACLVGVGRPVLWGLAADGEDGAGRVLDTLTAELRQAMAGVGVATLADLGRDLIRRAGR